MASTLAGSAFMMPENASAGRGFPSIDYIAFRSIVDERMRKEVNAFEKHGWRVRIVLVHPLVREMTQDTGEIHIIVPDRVVSHPIVNQLLLIPIILLLRYSEGFVRRRSRMRFLFVLNFPDSFAIPFLLLGRLFRLPTIYEIVDPWKEYVMTETEIAARGRSRFSLYYQILSLFELITQSLATGLVFASKSLEEMHAPQHPGKPVCLINNFSSYSPDDVQMLRGAEIVRQRFGLIGKLVVSYIGYFQEYRGIDILMQSMVRVSEENGNVRLLLVGLPLDVARPFYERMRELGIDRSCVLAGWKSNAELPAFYSASDIGIIPHKRTAGTEVADPAKLFNYLALGKPVIVTALAEQSRYVEQGVTGIKVNPDDPRDLARAILNLANNPKLLESMRKNALKVGEKYRFANIEPAFLDFVSRLAEMN